MITTFLICAAVDTTKLTAPATTQSTTATSSSGTTSAPPALQAEMGPKNIIDSILYYINLTQPDTFLMKAECSLDPEAKIEVSFSRATGINVKGDEFVGEVVRGALLLSGIGTPQYWKAIKIDTIIPQRSKVPEICYLTIIPKDTSLFTKATIRVKRARWKIEEAKVSTTSDEIIAKLMYNKMGMPISVDVVGKQSRIIVKHIYNNVARAKYIPFKTTLISAFSEGPEITVEYSPVKK